MIILKMLKWSNCFSYGADNELDLSDHLVTQLVGTNGVGKSSIPLIIEEVLYNKNSKGIKKSDIPNRYVDKGYSIFLAFSKDTDEYEVSVNRKTALKVSLKKNGKEISSHTATNTYKTIQEIVGVDFKTFSQLVYQNTNASLQFLTATDANRKRFLIDLLHLEEYTKLFELFKADAKAATTAVVQEQTKINTYESWLKDNTLEHSNILPLKKIENNLEEAEIELRDLLAELKNISEKNLRITSNNNLLNVLELNEKKMLELEDFAEMQDVSELTETFWNLKNSRKVLSDEASRLQAAEGICRTCGQDIDLTQTKAALEVNAKETEALNPKLDEVKQTLRGMNTHNKKVEEYLSAKQGWEQTLKSIDQSLPKTLLVVEELTQKHEKAKAFLKASKQEIAKLERENQEIEKRNTKIAIILEQREGFKLKLKEAREALEVVQSLSSNLEVLKKAFSTNGLLAYKLENLVVDLEELTNHYLAALSDGRFTLEFVVQSDKLNVQITDNGNIVQILALSSGELARVNTATLLAIRKLMSSISKSRINILFLDEVINVLDVTGRENLIEVLIKEESLNTYIVSHGWTHPLLDKVEVVKTDNVSKLEW